MIFIISGHLGSGKSLLAVRMAHEYLQTGRRVASNITLHLDALMRPSDRTTATKLPYIPTPAHLEALGRGYEGPYDEDRHGLVVLDEAGSWLNARDWNDKDRRGLFSWLTHARKYGWDVALIIQDIESLDAQIRRSILEVWVNCKRSDRIKLPYLPIKLPKYHIGTGRYGCKEDSPVFKRWIAKGDDYHAAYDTREAVKAEVMWTDSGPIDARAPYTLLSAWHLVGRYLPPRPGAGAIAVMFIKWGLVGLLMPFASNRGELAEALRLDLARVFPGLFPEQAKRIAAEYRASIIDRRTVKPARTTCLVTGDLNAYRLRAL
ncbi:MAG: hypothetical protein EPN60_16130 [Nevskiaceae bacterium]|nr:MAG: hypothetical protein EPN60_16130 [Nevskiaceae bacterium]